MDRYKYLEKTSTYSASSFHLPVSATSNKQAASFWSGCRKSFSTQRLYNSCRRYGCGHDRINRLCPRERSAINDLRLAASERQGERQEGTWCNRLESGNLGNSEKSTNSVETLTECVRASRRRVTNDDDRLPSRTPSASCHLSSTVLGFEASSHTGRYEGSGKQSIKFSAWREFYFFADGSVGW